MKKVFIAALFLSATSAQAYDFKLYCRFPKSNERVVITRNNGTVIFNWDRVHDHEGTIEIQNDILIATQKGDIGTFKLFYNLKDGTASGGTDFFDGHEYKKTIKCGNK